MVTFEFTDFSRNALEMSCIQQPHIIEHSFRDFIAPEVHLLIWAHWKLIKNTFIRELSLNLDTVSVFVITLLRE